MPDSSTAFIALGSNQRQPMGQVESALDELDTLPDTRLTGHSSLYRTRPWGVTDQPDFINAVARLDTGLGPRALLEALLGLERRHGRERREGPRWGPRSLDLDLLLYDDLVLDEEGLELPHPRMHERAFVMVPLMELAPERMIPGRGRVSEVTAGLDGSGVERLGAEETDREP